MDRAAKRLDRSWDDAGTRRAKLSDIDREFYYSKFRLHGTHNELNVKETSTHCARRSDPLQTVCAHHLHAMCIRDPKINEGSEDDRKAEGQQSAQRRPVVMSTRGAFARDNKVNSVITQHLYREIKEIKVVEVYVKGGDKVTLGQGNSLKEGFAVVTFLDRDETDFRVFFT